MASSSGELVFELTTEGLRRQEANLDEVRARVGSLISAASITAAFLGSALIASGQKTLLVLIGSLLFLAAIGLCIFVLGPRQGWLFSTDVKILLVDYAGLHLEEAYAHLCHHMNRWIEKNDKALKRLYIELRLALVALTAALAVWFVELWS